MDLDAIVGAARGVPRGDLTMQSVANRLGVDRKAVNHHVRDRDSLLALVAAADFAQAFAAGLDVGTTDWRGVCRAYVRALADSVSAAGGLIEHLRLDEAVTARYLTSTEAVLEALIGAGLGRDDAVRCMAVLTNTAMAHARDQILADRDGQGQRPHYLRRGLAGAADRHPLLAEVAAHPVDTYGPAQLDLALDLVLTGIADLAARHTDSVVPRPAVKDAP